MNESEFDLAARAWLDDGPTRMSGHAVLSALEKIHTTRQRRALWPAWRATPVNSLIRVATAAAFVVAIGVLAVTIIPRLPAGSSVGSPVDFPDLTTTFDSPRNGFSVKHPDTAEVTPATNLMGSGDDGLDVVDTGLGAVFTGTSTQMPPVVNGFLSSEPSDISIDGWVDSVQPDGECMVPRSQHVAISIDGQSGTISEDCPNEIEATVIVGGRLYLFTLLHDRTDARAVFDAFAATIDLTPETAIDVPEPDTTFVSPTYGFSFRYRERGAPIPATKRWDPANQLPLDRTEIVGADTDPDGFDYFETGFGAAFFGASTEIPDGVSVDTWFDASVARYLPDGCRLPRSQQAAITIDGLPGRMVECPETVAASLDVDGRLYLFVLLYSPREDGRDWFDAFAATIDLTPETAAARSTSP